MHQHFLFLCFSVSPSHASHSTQLREKSSSSRSPFFGPPWGVPRQLSFAIVPPQISGKLGGAGEGACHQVLYQLRLLE